MTIFRSLRWNLSWAIITIMASCLALISFLNYCNFEKDLHSFVRSRFLVVAQDLKASVEYGLNLGLGLKELKNVQQLIEESSQRDPDIGSLMVVDGSGTILFHSDQQQVGSTTPAAWLNNELLQRQGPALHRSSGPEQQTILPIVNHFNIMVGALVLSYPSKVIEEPKAEMRAFLLRRFLLIFAIFSLANLLLLYPLTSSLLAGVNELAEDLEKLNRDPEQGGSLTTQTELSAPYQRFVDSLRRRLPENS